jgi:hypothetical protein
VDGYQSSQGNADQRFEITCDSDGNSSPLPDACEEAPHTITGHVRDAVNLNILHGATLVIGDQTITLDSSHRYTVTLPAGQYDYTVSAEGYISISEGTLTLPASTDQNDIFMSPVMLNTDSYRIVLTWDEQPRDLDSYLVFHETLLSCDEMYYGNPRASCGGVEAQLDVDDTTSFGPETTTLSNTGECPFWRTCKWVYRVKSYSSATMQTFSHGWVASQAIVRLYNNDAQVATYRVGDNQNGVDGHGYTSTDGIFDFSHSTDDNAYFWSVFSIDRDGNVEPCTTSTCD